MTDTRAHTPVVIDRVSVRLGDRLALSGISFEVAGGVLALVGPNGAGKTTLLRTMCGDLAPDAGLVRVGVSDSTSERRRHVAYLPQDPQLHERMTCAEFVAYCGWLRNMSTRSARAAARVALEDVGLASCAADRVSTLSGGMKRRLAIGAALVSSPAVVLLDEPMAGLDPEQRFNLRQVLQDLAERATVVLATHVMQDVPVLTDRLVMLDGGRVRFDGDLAGFMGGEPVWSGEALERAFVRHLGREPE